MADSIETLRQANSIDEQVAALRRLKNDIVGHDQRKETIVRHGAIDVLVDILSSATKASGKRRSSVNGAAPAIQSWMLEDELRLQATLNIGTLANRGPVFVEPLLAGNAPRALLESLGSNAGSKLVTATLQALKNIASAWSVAQDGPDAASVPPLDLFTRQSIDVLQGLLRQPTTSPQGRQQLRLVAEILAAAARSETTQAMLAQSPLLDSLAALMASHSIASKHVDYYGETAHLPPPPPAAALPNILCAISAIIGSSTYRAHRFFLSPVVRELFLQTWPASGDQRHLFGARNGFAASNGEPLLPLLHVPAYGTTTYHYRSHAFPAMAALHNPDGRGHPVFENVPQGGDVDHANAVCSWLLLLARSMKGHHRLIALRLLAAVNNAVDADAFNSGHRSEYIQKTRERKKQIALLAVPLAVRLVQSVNDHRYLGELSERQQQDALLVKENACDVLALLVRDFDDLQIAAVEASAIKHVCPILKKSFDSVPLSKPMWSAKIGTIDPADLPPSHRLGRRGLPTEILHAMRCRQGALQALAALAEKEDLHRKAIVEAGVVPCIIDSLKPFSPDYINKLAAHRTQVSPKDGNTTAVILAACRAARTMSRSVSLLRTSLIDAGIAKPIFHLLSDQDPEIQLAATDVCINLLLEFSPMRDDLVAEGVIKTLTEHARRSSSALRLSSLWALKHLMLSSSREIKINTLEELGAGWLVSAIQGEQRDFAAAPSGGGVSVGLSTANAAGEQVDLLNPSTMDVDDPATDEQDFDDEDDDGEVMYDESSSTHYQASQLRSTLQPPPPTFNSKKYLSSVKEIEQNPSLRAKQDEVAVQEQALDFVRNILNGEDCAFMLDHLLDQIGSTKIFDLLTAKLTPLSHTTTRTTNTGTGTGSNTRPIYGPSELIVSSINILTHIANAAPRHKQLLIAQKSLLQAWLPHFNHHDRKVRVASVWAVNSLTWIEDDADRRDARQRAAELRAVGIDAAVRGLLGDADLDVKERAKTAVRQFDQL